MSKTVEKLKKYWPVLFLLFYFSLFYLVNINLFNSDIGRHIINGREIELGNKEIFSTNYYSYTQTDFPAINHHWLFGVFANWAHKIGEFGLLTWVNLLLNTSALSLILLVSTWQFKQKTRLVVWIVSLVGFFLMPLITHRAEVRPESVSLLFFALFYFLFSTKLVIKKWWLVVFVLIAQVIWVNTHLFFILGPLLAGYFLFEKFLILLSQKKPLVNFIKDKVLQFWLFFSITLFAVSILNPHLITGLLAPLTVFNNYAYRVAENQSSLFLINYGLNVSFFVYVVLISFVILILAIAGLKNNKTFRWEKIAKLILLTIFILLGNKIIRMTPFLAVVAIPIVAQIVHEILIKILKKHQEKIKSSVFIMSASTGIFVLAIFLLKLGFFTPKINEMGVGLLKNTFESSKFFIENNLKGPIFNNYDIGGYLIFTLFPQEKIFIDNRPAEYSGEFLQSQFLTSLIDESKWNQVSEKYQLNVIFFYRHDQIDGAQQFLFNRVNDESWIPVYVDDYVLIFVKNNQENKEIINKYKLPNEIFGMRPT